MERPDIDSPLKWPGGKRWILNHLRSHYDGKRRLVDPFSGGLSIPLGLKPDRCMFSDANVPLMNFWRWVQHGLEYDDNTGIEFANDRAIYYENRTKFNQLCEAREYWSKEAALLFYYLNRTCFNGLCRFNRRGYFNVPFGTYKNIPYKKDFLPYVEAMKGWQLYYGDFSCLPLERDDFIYADPPYDVEFTQYTPKDFSWDDQMRLARWLGSHPGPVVASNQATPRIIQLYQAYGFKIYSLEGPRRISCNGDRTPAQEIYATKNL